VFRRTVATSCSYSSRTHRVLIAISTYFRTREVPGARPPHMGAAAQCSDISATLGSASTYRWTAAVSSGPGRRNALGNARRRSARSRHPGVGCRCAPRPGSVPRGSGTQTPSTAVTRSRSCLAARSLHPTQVRSGHERSRVRPDMSKSTPLMVFTPNHLQRPSGDRPLRGGSAVAVVAGTGRAVALDVRTDVDAPAGETRGQTGVLALLADRQ
jgi:hypothetical protein